MSSLAGCIQHSPKGQHGSGQRVTFPLNRETKPWFHRDGSVFAIAPILASFRNRALAAALWPKPHYASERTGDWCHIFAFTQPAPAMINKRVINKILAHREGDRWQNPRLLTESESQRLSGRLIWALNDNDD